MTKDDIKWMLGIMIGLFLGGAGTYATLMTDDALTRQKVDQLERCSEQFQKDVNIFRVKLSQIAERTDMQLRSSNDAISTLTVLLKKNTESNHQLAIAIARLEERQEKTDKVLEKLATKIEARR